MLQKSAPLHLELRPSRIFSVLLLVVHGGAAGCVLIAPFPWPVRLVLTGAILFSLCYTVSRWALLTGRRAIIRLAGDEPGKWVVTLASGKRLQARLLSDSFVSPHCVILNLAPSDPSRRFSAIIFSDSLDRHNFRRLRVRLRLEGAQAPE